MTRLVDLFPRDVPQSTYNWSYWLRVGHFGREDPLWIALCALIGKRPSQINSLIADRPWARVVPLVDVEHRNVWIVGEINGHLRILAHEQASGLIDDTSNASQISKRLMKDICEGPR
jgi:hypothetical protein